MRSFGKTQSTIGLIQADRTMKRSDKLEDRVPSTDLDALGGHLALDFINTLRAKDGAPLETLNSDRDVLGWYAKMHLDRPRLLAALPGGSLLQSARALRHLALAQLEKKKAGKKASLTRLNEWLSDASSHLRLHLNKQALVSSREYEASTAEQFLAPVAEAIADLLANGDFSLIRQCEGSDCVLWFAHRANGRPRRFCTEETCGNRARVAAFRARNSALP